MKSHTYHFQALLCIFLLPFSFSIIIYPIIFKSQPDSSFSIRFLINLLYVLFVTILYVCAVGSINYSTFHAFYGTPIDVITSIKSIFHSFFPLLSTLIIEEVIMALISWPFLYQAVHLFGSKSFYKSSYSYIVFIIILTVLFALIMIYIQASWILVSVIVMVESKRGWEPMQRSGQLVKGKRGVAFLMVLGLVVGAFFWGFYARFSGNWDWDFVLRITTASIGLSFLLQLIMVANVVLYIYCIEEMHAEVLPNLSAEQFPLLS